MADGMWPTERGGVNRAIRKRVRSYFQDLYERKTAFDEEEVLKLMPPPMAREIIKEVYADMLTNLLLFRGLDEEVIMKMCLELRPYTALTGDNITTEGQLGTELYIIQHGFCTVRSG